jgi:DNA-binding NarL/FixJ family response regulator
MIRFILSEKYSLLRDGIRAISRETEDLNIVGEATTIYETKQLIHSLAPEMILLCSNIADSTHKLMELISYSYSHCNERKLLIITTLDEISSTYNISKLMAIGASGFVLKEEGAEVLVNVIRTVIGGDTWYSKPILEKLIHLKNDHLTQQLQQLGLTDRDKKLLSLLAHGLNNAQIAKELILGQQTVRNYMSCIYNKLEVNSRSEAIVWARKHGFHEKSNPDSLLYLV